MYAVVRLFAYAKANKKAEESRRKEQEECQQKKVLTDLSFCHSKFCFVHMALQEMK